MLKLLPFELRIRILVQQSIETLIDFYLRAPEMLENPNVMRMLRAYHNIPEISSINQHGIVTIKPTIENFYDFVIAHDRRNKTRRSLLHLSFQQHLILSIEDGDTFLFECLLEEETGTLDLQVIREVGKSRDFYLINAISSYLGDINANEFLAGVAAGRPELHQRQHDVLASELFDQLVIDRKFKVKAEALIGSVISGNLLIFSKYYHLIDDDWDIRTWALETAAQHQQSHVIDWILSQVGDPNSDSAALYCGYLAAGNFEMMKLHYSNASNIARYNEETLYLAIKNDSIDCYQLWKNNNKIYSDNINLLYGHVVEFTRLTKVMEYMIQTKEVNPDLILCNLAAGGALNDFIFLLKKHNPNMIFIHYFTSFIKDYCGDNNPVCRWLCLQRPRIRRIAGVSELTEDHWAELLTTPSNADEIPMWELILQPLAEHGDYDGVVRVLQHFNPQHIFTYFFIEAEVQWTRKSINAFREMTLFDPETID